MKLRWLSEKKKKGCDFLMKKWLFEKRVISIMLGLLGDSHFGMQPAPGLLCVENQGCGISG